MDSIIIVVIRGQEIILTIQESITLRNQLTIQINELQSPVAEQLGVHRPANRE